MIKLILSAVVRFIALGAAAALVYSYFSMKKLKELIMKMRKKTKVVFGNLRVTIERNIKSILENAPKISKDDLEDMSKKDQYFVANYDDEAEDVTEVTTIQADKTEAKIDKLLNGTNDGIVILE